jgi:peroxiredoxin
MRFLKIIISILLIGISLQAQDNKKLPSVNVKDLDGKVFNTSNIHNDGKPIVISFWATWCKPCIQELANMHDLYQKWQKETGVKVIAISIDDSRSSKKVKPFVSGRSWTYEFLLDENSEFKRAMNVNNPPHTFLIDGNGNIVYEHNGYAPGDEKKLYQEIKKLAK